MGFTDKLRNRLLRNKGAVKERIGRRGDYPYLKLKGRAERYEGGARQVGEHLKDAAKEVRKTVK